MKTMYHHQRIHHRSRSLSPHDSPPRHSPPHDPHYHYCQPYATSLASTLPCPHCGAPATSFHMDPAAGDLVCTRCGAVLDDHLRDETAEWREYNNAEDVARGNGPGGKRARCGDMVDESKWVGGLMPTRMGGVFAGTGFGGTGSGAGAGTADEKHRLAVIRGRLKRTHNMIENMVEQEQKTRYAEVVLERRARDARLERGEAMDEGEDGGIAVTGDFEGLIMRRKEQEDSSWAPTAAKSSASSDQEKAFQSLEDKKWSLADAVLLYGTLDQVQQWARSFEPNGEEWTQDALEASRTQHAKKFDVVTSTSLHKLCTAFAILEKAAHKLQFEGPSNPTFREAVGWFLKFVSKNNGLRVRGISGGSSSLKSVKNAGDFALSLSLFGGGGAVHPSAWSRSKSSSLSTELHRLRQYASLGSAILYLSAKRTCVGRTLTEVCSAFGTFAVVHFAAGRASTGDGGKERAGEPLVRPKYCSRAMQELRAALPEVASSTGEGGGGGTGGGASSATGKMAAMSPAMSPSLSITEEVNAEAPAKVSPNYGPISAVPLLPVPVKSEFIPDAQISSSNHMVNTEEAALADLVARMGTSLDLPPCAISAAAAVAVQSARDARTLTTLTKASPLKRSNGKAHMRPRQRKARGPRQSRKDASPEVVAVASLLLVCTAGGTMQRLSQQALSNKAPSTSPPSSSNKNRLILGGTADFMSNPLDELHEDLSHPSTPKSDPVGSDASIKATPNEHATAEQRALSSWTTWNRQPPWHRDISRMERCAGVPRRAIVSYYSHVLHPRRLYFLGIAKKEGGRRAGPLMHNITAAVPLMSLRNL